MYTTDTMSTGATAAPPSYGVSAGKSTLTSRLSSASGAPAGTPASPPELIARAGDLVRDGGFALSIEPDGSFAVLAAPPGQELLIGRRVPAGAADPSLAPVWQALVDRALGGGGEGGLAPILTAGLGAGGGGGGGQVGIEPWLTGGGGGASIGGPAGPTGPTAPTTSPAAPTPDEERNQLAILLREPTLTVEQIAWCREVIARQPAALQGDYYAQLQRKSPYANERDNQATWARGTKVEASTGNMCNLTSLAMCLQSLGIAKPTDVAPPAGVDAAGLQYEDALFYLWQKLGSPGGNIIYFTAWEPLCTALGATGTRQGSLAGKKADWEARIRDAHLRAGHAVMAGGWGHVVRIQDVTEAGVIVDDPYGGSNRPAASWPDGANARDDGAGATRGDDCTWPWPADQTIALPWYFTIAR